MHTLDRHIPLGTVANLRDFGGITTPTGTIVPGRVLRSASLAKLDATDGATLVSRGVTAVVDFRTAGEISAAPDQLPPEITASALDVLADSAHAAAAANLAELMADPSQFLALLQGGDAAELLRDSYRDIVALPSALAAYREFFLGLAHGAHDEAVLFHCTTGKDRTGWAAVTLLTIAGASEADILADYLQTNRDLLPTFSPLFARVAAAGADPDLLIPLLGVDESYLAAARTEVRTRFGDMSSYLSEGLGLGEPDRAAIRDRLTRG